MRTIWLVVKHEIVTTLRKRSFWIMTILLLALLLGLNIFIEPDTGQPRSSASDEGETSPPALPKVGLVDQSGLIEKIPPELPDGVFVPYQDPSSALAALQAGDIDQYVVIPADYLSNGDVTVYDTQFSLLSGGDEQSIAFGSGNEWMLRMLIDQNLAGDRQLAAAIFNPTPATQHVLAPEEPEVAAADQKAAGAVARIMPYIFYFVLIVGSGYLLQSVTAEKENRTAEVLLLSLRPRDLMIGKVIGLGVIAFLQLAIWLGVGAFLLNRGSTFLNLSDYSLPLSFYVWAVLFLLFGYLLYGSIMAAGGAIAPSAREGGQLTWVLIVPLMPTLMFSSEFLEAPNGALSVALSLIPFSAPSAMVTRLAVADVPLWQPLLSLAGLAVTAYIFMSLSARFFRADNLVSQASFTWRRFATGWRR